MAMIPKNKPKKQYRKVKNVPLTDLPNPNDFCLVVQIHNKNLIEPAYRPSVKHSSVRAAGDEARRLARKFKKQFAVLTVIGWFDKDGNGHQ